MNRPSNFFYFAAILMFSLCSCNVYKKEIPTGSPYKLSNVYASPSYDHSQVVKTVLMPIHNPNQDEGVSRYEKELISSALKNFGKFNYFHMQYDASAASRMSDEGTIDLQTGEYHRMKLGELGREYHAQSILKVSVSEFRPFFPMFIKIKSSLVDTQTGEAIWVFDHVFDISDADVINGMKVWWNSTKAGGDKFLKFNSAVNRPSAFLDFVFYSIAKSYGDIRVRNLEAIQKQKIVEKSERDELKSLQKSGGYHFSW
ncbi:hypothetical protein AB751O23_AD_00140 [Chlamydiales bacterium SCGC AB-751-O23]|jgi:hypothetical protein|nr:hypothetical protein AB751O23_AD_00140 [Chlamydiales bacterium SCGC AB-751-O23]